METTQKQKTSPKDFFLYFGAIVTLYISAISVLTLLFEVIDQLFPKPFEYVDPYAGGVSLAIAMLIVAFPLYLLFMRITAQGESEFPEKRELSIRKWLTYLTLFVAGAAIAVDLIVLLQKFFAGEEITLAFGLKVISIILVLAAVFGYYLYDLRHIPSASESVSLRKRFAYGSSTFVILVIVIGFFVMGSPYTQKEKRFDAERVSNLQQIQNQIISYWQAKQKLPATLNDLTDPLSGFVLPVDPTTQAPYEYVASGKFSFQLCAVFSRETPSSVTTDEFSRPVPVYKDPMNENWQHGVGKVCFARTLDPDRYPPLTANQKPVPMVR